jgi:hypothetical protein
VKWGYGFLKLPKVALERTYISLPILKRSAAAGFSGAMKMQKGLLLPKMKKVFHKLGLHKPIAELNAVIQPSLTILDFSNFSCPNFLVGADNPHEADLEAVRFLGIPEPEYVRIGREIGVSARNYEVTGDSVTGRPAKQIEEEKGDPKKILGLRFWVSPRTCSMCRFLFQDIKQLGSGGFLQKAQMYGKLLGYALSGADIVLGYEDFAADSRKVICIGDCTKKMANERGFRHVGGCPPSKEDLVKSL